MYAGFRAIMMSPWSFLQHPVRWLSAISRYRAAVGGGPNFAYDLLARSVTEVEKSDLDLSSWRSAFCGAEPIQAATIDRFVRAFAPCGFRPDAFLPGYGLAEATLLVSAKHEARPVRRVDYAASKLESHVAERTSVASRGSRT